MNDWVSLDEKEVQLVVQKVNAIWHTDIMSQILHEHALVKREGERSEVYLIPHSDLYILDLLVSSLVQQDGQLVYAKTKLGFFIRNQFNLGIEPLGFLLSVAIPPTRKLVLELKETEQFIYGKNLKRLSRKTLQQLEGLVARGIAKEVPIVVLSRDRIPLGLVSYRVSGNTKWLLNLIDVGIYLRAEKTAF